MGTALTGKRILVTGGTTGIGRAPVMLLAREGANVFIFGRHQTDLDKTLDAGTGLLGSIGGTTAMLQPGRRRSCI